MKCSTRSCGSIATQYYKGEAVCDVCRSIWNSTYTVELTRERRKRGRHRGSCLISPEMVMFLMVLFVVVVSIWRFCIWLGTN